MVKKLALAGVAALTMTGFVSTASAVEVAASNNGHPASPYESDDLFVVNDFVFAVSANVALESAEDAVAIAVSTASNKGRNEFSGSSNGGAVKTCGDPTVGAATPEPQTPSLTAGSGCASGS